VRTEKKDNVRAKRSGQKLLLIRRSRSLDPLLSTIDRSIDSALSCKGLAIRRGRWSCGPAHCCRPGGLPTDRPTAAATDNGGCDDAPAVHDVSDEAEKTAIPAAASVKAVPSFVRSFVASSHHGMVNKANKNYRRHERDEDCSASIVSI
jgi:hypothetical protein